MTILKERPIVKDRPAAPVREKVGAPRKPPVRPRRRPVRWIEWSIVFVVAAMAVTAYLLTRDGWTAGEPVEAFEDVYEAESGLSYGARHDPTFALAPRWVGESDMTLEEFEATLNTFENIYEAESGLSYGARHAPGFTVTPRWVGESDFTLEEFEAVFEPFATRYEAGSSLSYGARHDPGFTVPPRWVGESDMTLEESETG
jgi:hypothetical protein